MATFEGYDRRIAKIEKTLAEYGFSDLDAMAQYVKDNAIIAYEDNNFHCITQYF